MHYCNPDDIGVRLDLRMRIFLKIKKMQVIMCVPLNCHHPDKCKGCVCTFDDEGNCVEFKLCTQDWRHPRDIETCSEIDEHRAWSSPIYVDFLLIIF